MKQIVLLLGLILLAGCAGPFKNDDGYVQFHTGEPLPPNQKAIVEGHYGYRDGSLANEMVRIVEINGTKLPREFGVAPGANKVSLLPGYYELKVLYVHGEDHVDYYAYELIPALLKANCTYRVVTRWSSFDKTMQMALLGRPSRPEGGGDCRFDTSPNPDAEKAQGIQA